MNRPFARTPGAPPAPGTVLVLVLATLAFVLPLATDMYLPGFPRMAADLGSSASGVQLSLTTFMVGITVGQFLVGPLSDRYGRRGPLLIGTAITVVATAACAVAPSLAWLVVLRLVQGLAAAAGLVIGRAVIADVAAGRQAARIYSVQIALSSTAPIVAPLLGGLLVSTWGWRGVFWALTAATALMVVGVVTAVPETRPPERRTPAGLANTVRAARGVAANRRYLGFALAFALSYAALFCFIGGSSFFYQNVLGLGIGGNAVAFAVAAATVTVTSAVNSRLVVAWSTPRRLLRAGLALMAVGTVALVAVAVLGALSLVPAVALLEVFFVGLGLVVANATALALAEVPDAAGTGSAVLGTLQTGLAAVVAPLIGLGGDHPAVAMPLGMAVCALLAGLVRRWGAVGGDPETEPTEECAPAWRESAEPT